MMFLDVDLQEPSQQSRSWDLTQAERFSHSAADSSTHINVLFISGPDDYFFLLVSVSVSLQQQWSSVAWHESPTGAHRLRESRAHTGLDGSCPLPEASCCPSSEQRTVSCERNKNSLCKHSAAGRPKTHSAGLHLPSLWLTVAWIHSGDSGHRYTGVHVCGASKTFICKVALVHFQLQDVFYISWGGSPKHNNSMTASKWVLKTSFCCSLLLLTLVAAGATKYRKNKFAAWFGVSVLRFHLKLSVFILWH